MKRIKKILFSLSPRFYFYSRDRFQFLKSLLSGDVAKIKEDSMKILGFDSAFEFTNRYIKSYQIRSEIQRLVELIQSVNPKSYLEIGTADGGTHYLIRRLCDSIQISVAIDTDIRNKLLIDEITSTNSSHYITGRSNDSNTLLALERIFSGTDKIDVLFIDGDHSYEGVKCDFELYNKFVAKGGLIIFHDIVEDWGQRYGRETNKYTGGVPQFFSEISDNYECHIFIDDPEQDGYGIGVIVKD